MPQPSQTFRLGEETLRLIGAIAAHHRDALGQPLAATRVVRLAVRQLAESVGVLPKKEKKKAV